MSSQDNYNGWRSQRRQRARGGIQKNTAKIASKTRVASMDAVTIRNPRASPLLRFPGGVRKRFSEYVYGDLDVILSEIGTPLGSKIYCEQPPDRVHKTMSWTEATETTLVCFQWYKEISLPPFRQSAFTTSIYDLLKWVRGHELSRKNSIQRLYLRVRLERGSPEGERKYLREQRIISNLPVLASLPGLHQLILLERVGITIFELIKSMADMNGMIVVHTGIED